MDEDVVARLRAAGCVFAEDEAELLAQAVKEDAEPSRRLEVLVGRRCAGEPLEHVVGLGRVLRAADRGRAGGVRAPAALGVPGRARARPRAQAPGVVDLCCGSAPFATVLATRLPGAEVHAADIDPAQLAHAREQSRARRGGTMKAIC